MEGLDRAVESAIANYVERNKSKVMKNPSNVFCQALRKVLGKMELMMLTNDEIAIEEEREALRHYIIRNKRQLHTTEDLLSAMQYVKGISNRFGSTGGGAEGVEAAVLSDPKVISAQEQLLLWRHAAAIFLVRQQAKDALNSYHLLLAETLTKVRRS
ncbi:unnamed protein product [Trypanosoma congolense IL3000]|uniref:WGS project CAEQ00000000 data, annotated contig 944 n=1 Tax=Trypanosoma congolense (strain IL3000) TaxID=1068625 RepID=F9WJS1_TRYCI|nr:unnamed protein product [Trypanosoma congolense IL3000]